MGQVRGPEGRFELISAETCGARAIRLSVVSMEPGVKDNAHWHVNGEKVMYVTGGHGQILTGQQLETSLSVGPGDAVYVPPFAVHAPMNDGDEPLVFIMVGNAAFDVMVPG